MPRVRRGNYRTTKQADRERILDSANRGEDFVAVAAVLGVKRTTAYNIVRSGIVRTSMTAIDQPKCRQWYIHTQTYLPTCISGGQIAG